MLQTLPALFISSPRGLVFKVLGEREQGGISAEHVWVLPGDKALRRGCETEKAEKPQGGQENGSGQGAEEEEEEGEKIRFILVAIRGSTYLPLPSGEPCWPRYFQSPLSECESQAVAIHFTRRKKDGFF